MVGVSTVTKTHWFGFTQEELEMANVFINDGWQGDLHSLQFAVEKLTESFGGLNNERD